MLEGLPLPAPRVAQEGKAMARHSSWPSRHREQGQTSSFPPRRLPASSRDPLALGPCLVAVFARGLQREWMAG